MKFRLKIISFSAPLVALSLAVSLTSLILVSIGKNPIETFLMMYEYGTTGKSIVSILNRTIPLYISAIAVAVGFKMGLFNIGVEGQYLLGALIAAALGTTFSVVKPLHIILIMLIAVVTSSLWGAIAGYLKVYKGIHEVISTIMLNYIGVGLIAYSLSTIFFDKDEKNAIPQTVELPETGQLPPLNNFLNIEDLPNLHGFLPIAIFLGFAYYWLVWKTTLGYDLRVTGANPVAAKFSGVDPKKLTILAMIISGGFAGLVGMGPLLSYFHQYTIDFPPGLGFAGIGVALLGRNHPIGMALGALLFAFLDRSSQILDLRDVPKEIETMMSAFILLIVVVFYEIIRRYIVTQQIKDASKKVDSDG
ncbi:MAG: ABC transporter permease [Proteobacteria bacterium]|nr:ABC transporter permease [Pseudomonadota bacterium]